MKNLTYLCFFIFSLLFSCTSNKEVTTGNKMALSEPGTISCQLIEKEFINKGGKVQEYKELYLRCSVQDYFIKFCESNVTSMELEPYLNSGITVKMEIREGRWDHCEGDPDYAQSRIGKYVVILAIEK